MLLRTFSKVYGLCGLRVGFALCGSEAFRTAVDQVRQPFFCNAAAQAAAVEALNHQDEVTRRVERNLAERIGLEDGLRRLGLEPAESQANFVWFDLPEARSRAEAERDVLKGLAERGDPRAQRRRRSAARARCASRSAPRPRTSASWKRWPRCSVAGTFARVTDRSAQPARTYPTGLAGAAGRRDAYATWRFS